MGVEPQALSAVFRLADRPLVVAGVGCFSRRLYQCRHLEIAHDLTMGNLLAATAYQYEVQVKDEVGNASALIAGSFITAEAPDSVPSRLLNNALPLDPSIELSYTVQVVDEGDIAESLSEVVRWRGAPGLSSSY